MTWQNGQNNFCSKVRRCLSRDDCKSVPTQTRTGLNGKPMMWLPQPSNCLRRSGKNKRITCRTLKNPQQANPVMMQQALCPKVAAPKHRALAPFAEVSAEVFYHLRYFQTKRSCLVKSERRKHYPDNWEALAWQCKERA